MTSDNIEITVPGGALPAYLALAEHGRAAAGVVLLQEIFGVNANMREIADDYAARGFNAIVPALFWRQQPDVQLDPGRAEDRERAVQLMNGMDLPLALQDALAAVRHVRMVPGASGKAAAVGYCLGGKLAYLLASSSDIDAAVSYYGVAIQGALEHAASIQCPLLLHIAEEDHLCPPAAQKAIIDALAPCQGVEILTYPGAGHAFARRGSPAFNSDAATRANRATQDFLQAAFGASA